MDLAINLPIYSTGCRVTKVGSCGRRAPNINLLLSIARLEADDKRSNTKTHTGILRSVPKNRRAPSRSRDVRTVIHSE